MSNPYQFPQRTGPQFPHKQVAPQHDPFAKLKPPAICLIVCVFLGVANVVTGVALRVMADDFNPDLGDPEFIGNLVAIVLLPIYYGLMLWGAISMLNGKNYAMCMTAAVLACIPLCSPCIVLGIPFGIWSLIVLNDVNVKAAFR